MSHDTAPHESNEGSRAHRGTVSEETGARSSCSFSKMEDLNQAWQCAPREVLVHIFKHLPLKYRCQVVGIVCSWWRKVALEEAILNDFNLCTIPLFAVRSQHVAHFLEQRDSFLCWLKHRAPRIRSLIMQAERWEDDGLSLHLRAFCAQVLGGHLHSLKLVSTGGGQVTSAFLEQGSKLEHLQIDFWGSGNGLPKALSCCTSLTSLHIQCSSRLERYAALECLRRLQDLTVIDSDWGALPRELCRLPLTRLYLRFADFDGAGWLPLEASAAEPPGPTTPRLPAPPPAAEGTPAAPSPLRLPGASLRGSTGPGSSGTGTTTLAGGRSEIVMVAGRGRESTAGGKVTSVVGTHSGGLPCTLRELTLHGCQLSELPLRVGALTTLSALCLDRNGALQELPADALGTLRALRVLSLEGCHSVQALGEGVTQLPLQSLNLQDSGVRELPPGPYLSSLTTLRWGPVPGTAPASSALVATSAVLATSPAARLAQRQAQAAGAADELQGELSWRGGGGGGWEEQGHMRLQHRRGQLPASFLPGIERATELKELYLAGVPDAQQAQQRAQQLFAVLPQLQKVCFPQRGWLEQRGKQ